MKYIFTGVANRFNLPPPDFRRVHFSNVSRRCLQIMVVLGGCVPVSAGLAGMILGPAFIDHDKIYSITLDSHFRYLSGLLFGLGLGFWSTVPNIQKQTNRFQVLSMLVIVGGLGRTISLFMSGTPSRAMFFGLGMELLIVPLLAFWQFRVSHLTYK